MSKSSIVVIGAGFAGLNFVKDMKNANQEIILIDKNNYHTFYPLLYQVSAAELTSEQIAFPIRSFLRNYKNTEFVMGKVTQIDKENR